MLYLVIYSLGDGGKVDNFVHNEETMGFALKYYKNNGHRLKVATKYPHIAAGYFKKRGIYVELIKLYGSVELAPQVDLADMIVDIVSTGRTLKENKLEIINEIIPLSAQLIVNRISYKTKHKRITGLLQDIKKFISLESDKIAEW